MKEKLPLKVVSILGENKPRGHTRTHPTQNQHSAGRLLYLLDVGER